MKVNEKGPNGYRVGFTKNGDKVEWIPDDCRPGKKVPLLLCRNDKARTKAYNEFHERVWWVRHKVWLENIKSGKERLTKEQRPILAHAKQKHARSRRSTAEELSY